MRCVNLIINFASINHLKNPFPVFCINYVARGMTHKQKVQACVVPVHLNVAHVHLFYQIVFIDFFSKTKCF